MEWYVLKDHKPIKCKDKDIEEWEVFYENIDNRLVAKYEKYGIYVSTVFLGIDHNMFLDGPPIFFETMIFGGKYDRYQERYSTWEEAEEGHKRALAIAFPKGFLSWCGLIIGAIGRYYKQAFLRYKKSWQMIKLKGDTQ